MTILVRCEKFTHLNIRGQIFPGGLAEQRHGIDEPIPAVGGEVEVGSGGVAGASHPPDLMPGQHPSTGSGQNGAQVSVHRGEPLPLVDADVVAENGAEPGVGDHTVAGREDRGSVRDGDVDP